MPLSLAVPNSTDIDSLQRSSFGGQLADGDPSNRNASDKTKCIQILGAQNEALIKHFTHVTQSFLAPLEKYFASLIPLQKKVTAWRPIPKIQNFNKRDVLKLIATAEPHGLTLTRNADIVALYSEFMACPNFDRWLKTKVKRANEAMWTYYISQLETADVTEFMTGHSEIEAVDLILRLKEMSEMRNELITDNVVKLMRGHAETIEEGLPDDLRQSIVHR
ncbi:hypothetical protein SARC_01503 [Sphaeroforma arctica JP610]|uniref:Uncharacterized protein n=1 Tax=Sphaeroforma arctica JP610 TaxID=667725 RepID=A0A0L0GBQ9_9EUKA|nr:hypothetical protein SARC_01503 [Sphaeroforma arctica JP610]KNC86344.1 hypothetical protein SARC_01503 [Sphaeroforma arctica JP610]|eukprot:XP_014160246.1 hypothetical protein SARC_01503 [Sphaeroforma arctica JP610]